MLSILYLLESLTYDIEPYKLTASGRMIRTIRRLGMEIVWLLMFEVNVYVSCMHLRIF